MAHIPQTLRTSAQQLRTRRDHLRIALDRILRVDSDANAQVTELMQDRVFSRLGPQHHARTRVDIANELRQVRGPAAAVALYHTTQAADTLGRELRVARERAVRPPDAVDWYLQRTGGMRLNLKDSDEVLLQLLDEVRTSRLRAELQDAPPSVVLAAYTEALNSTSDESGSVVRYVERHHGRAWSGAPTSVDEEVSAATSLRWAIAEARSARVPAELTDLDALADEARRLASKAAAAEMYNLRPVDPDASSAFAQHFGAELPAWDAEIAARGEAQS